MTSRDRPVPEPAVIRVDHAGKPMLILELKLTAANVSVWADLQFRDTPAGSSRTVRVHYVCSDLLISAQVDFRMASDMYRVELINVPRLN